MTVTLGDRNANNDNWQSLWSTRLNGKKLMSQLILIISFSRVSYFMSTSLNFLRFGIWIQYKSEYPLWKHPSQILYKTTEPGGGAKMAEE